MNQLTPEQEKAYIKDGWAHCPVCKSEQIEGGHIEVIGNEAYQEVRCLEPNCDHAWNDIYTLNSVELIDN